jgi:hypothetical protein
VALMAIFLLAGTDGWRLPLMAASLVSLGAGHLPRGAFRLQS